MPLLSIVVPAYNAQAYLDRALAGLETVSEVEIVVIDDGSTDDTGEIADRWAQKHPDSVRVVHQPNRGHGGAITAGLAAARGVFFKVLDADDWLDISSLRTLIGQLTMLESKDAVDAVFTDFVHERVGKAPRLARFDAVFPSDRVFTWSDTERFGRRHVLMMHAITYRTHLLRTSGLHLPEHTFYVDNLFVVKPLAHVRRMRYLPIPLYRYFIGRDGQSVAPDVMVRRVDQQLLVNRLALAALPQPEEVARGVIPRQLHRALLHHVEGVCAVTSATLARAGTSEHLLQRDSFWREVRAENPWLYTRMRRTLIGTTSNLPGLAGRRATTFAYHVARRVVGFS
ncbi:glycosyltransferase family 2 protein [Microbacterium sp. 22303]|uniref:glycosyltransferase family 2 protein n=1 Tax=Microbacterium sp. 22303 TaxID=3453905 RepID=UPI003F84B81C